MNYWIVSSKHSRDDQTKGWESKWTADNVLKSGCFFPSKREKEFKKGDKCILKVFNQQDFIADFELVSEIQQDSEEDFYFRIGNITEWDFPVDEHNLPDKYRQKLSRSPSTDISEKVYYELLGIRNFTQNLKINYRNRLKIHVSEQDIEDLLDSKNALSKVGLTLIDRQLEITKGNKIDLLAKDRKGDLVVIELKKGSANQTIGQLARYINDVREHKAKSTQKVKGLILSFDIDEQLIKAARAVDFEVMLYEILMD